jgi:hypothetical protein
MNSTLDKAKISHRDRFYFRARLKNNIFHELLECFYAQSKSGKMNKKSIADVLGKDAGWVSRQFAGPRNLELETLSDLLLAMDSELEVKAVPIRKSQHDTAGAHLWSESSTIPEPRGVLVNMRSVSANDPEQADWANDPKDLEYLRAACGKQ